ncbi:MAG: PrsW family glutamic-type intramembrane protease [Acidimicrobiia bacterium]|nr:PrsW family glutamic-type intramembrane protease [Acidimicrobiia bacterium]
MQSPVPAASIDHAADEPVLATAAAGLQSYADDYHRRRDATPPWRRWFVVVLAILVAGPLGVVGAFLGAFASVGSLPVVVFAVVLIGPAVEEFVKAASGFWLAEQRPWLVPSGWVLVVIVVAGGLGFAAIENWIYLNIYIEDPSDAIIRWRWIFGPLIHGSASLLAGLGVRKVWQMAHDTGTRPNAHLAFWWFVAAVALHGTYNAGAVILEALEVF